MTNNSENHLSANENVAWGYFLCQGLLQHRHQEILFIWHQGYVELLQAVCATLPLIQEALLPYEKEECVRPSVLEYDVIQPFGKYLGDFLLTHKGNLPSEIICQGVIHDLLFAFYQGNEIKLKAHA